MTARSSHVRCRSQVLSAAGGGSDLLPARSRLHHGLSMTGSPVSVVLRIILVIIILVLLFLLVFVMADHLLPAHAKLLAAGELLPAAGGRRRHRDRWLLVIVVFDVVVFGHRRRSLRAGPWKGATNVRLLKTKKIGCKNEQVQSDTQHRGVAFKRVGKSDWEPSSTAMPRTMGAHWQLLLPGNDCDPSSVRGS
jgi:hypothetical protein